MGSGEVNGLWAGVVTKRGDSGGPGVLLMFFFLVLGAYYMVCSVCDNL